MDDAVGAVHHALFTDELSGPVNAAAPEPVTSRTFAATLGRVLHRPALIPAPAPALKLLFGEMAETALLGEPAAVAGPAARPRATPSGIPGWRRRCATCSAERGRDPLRRATPPPGA